MGKTPSREHIRALRYVDNRVGVFAFATSVNSPVKVKMQVSQMRVADVPVKESWRIWYTQCNSVKGLRAFSQGKNPLGISRGALMEFLLLHDHEAPGMVLRDSQAVRVVKGDSSKT